MKTPEEIKRGLKLCSHEGHGEEIICEHCPYDSNSCAVLICTRRLSADALAYIQQLETENHQLLTKAQQLESTISQVSKALCGKENATLKELLQAADQLKARAPTIEAEPVRHGRWEWIINWGCTAYLEPIEPYDAGWGCSVCGIDLMRYLQSHYPDIPSYLECACEEMPTLERCPCCGAEMNAKDIDVPGKICPATKLPCCDCVPGTPCAKMDGGSK